MNDVIFMKKFKEDLYWLFSYFLIFAFLGWVWEVIYKFYRYHILVNRGMNHLPWLPLYGWGSIILLFMYIKMKKKTIFRVFFGSATLCSALEYFASWILQVAFGLRWWNYRNYFMNINGRICLQSFLLFGVLGVIGMYLIIPFIYNLLEKLKDKKWYKIVIPFIMIIFMGDLCYSFISPNKGSNITYSNRTDKDVEVDKKYVHTKEEISINKNIECMENLMYCKGKSK